MNHATTYRSGQFQNAQEETATGFAVSNSTVCSVAATNQRRTGTFKRPKAKRSDFHASNGFLNTVFLPKWKAPPLLPPAKEADRMESDFYRSLSLFAAHYSAFIPSDTKTRFPFPYNISLSFREVAQFLKDNVSNQHSLKIMQDEKGNTVLVNEESYPTGSSLYYLPLLPLYRLLQSKETRKAACLLLSVFSYLYKVVQIPCYTQKGSYLYWQYEMLREWVESGDEEDYKEEYLRELTMAWQVGEWMMHNIANPKNLDFLGHRVIRFKAVSDWERQCLSIAQQALRLHQDFPSCTVFEHADGLPEDYEEHASMAMYISFSADAKGRLFDLLADSINAEFSEYAGVQEPMIIRKFSTKKITDNTLEFESRLFPLLANLCDFLYDY